MPNNQSQSPNSAKAQAAASSNQSSPQPSATESGDAFEQAISKGISSLMKNLEPQLNRIASQIANRVMSRGHNFADTGVKRMQEQPWYLVGGALALVAVGVGLLFAYDAEPKPDFSDSNIQ